MKRSVLGWMPIFALTIPLFAGPPAARPSLPNEEKVRCAVAQIIDSDTEKWRRIPWSPSLSAAAEAARKEGRPMFVFSHEGNMDTGRC
jgi:hypothetical protein